MDQFSISQLSRFSGVKAHTIRIWEQRYKALNPRRTEGNTRYYNGDQLRRLLNIVSLSRSGQKVSRLCAMNDEQLFSLMKDYHSTAVEQSDYEYFLNGLISAGMNYDEKEFSSLFTQCLEKFGLEKSYTKIIYPLLDRVGLMWSGNEMPASREHFISNLIKQKLFSSIDELTVEPKSSEKWLLFLPENEFHEIGLLFANYFIKSKGRQVIYLGANVPLASVKQSLQDSKATHLLLFLVHKDLPQNISEYLQQLSEVLRDQTISIACSKDLAEGIPSKAGIRIIHSVEELEKELDKSNITIT